MKQRFTEEQIVKVLNEHQNGRPATEIVRELGIAEQTFYNWEHKYGGMGVSERKARAVSADDRRVLADS